MKKQLNPTTTQANLAFLILIVVILIGSAIFTPILGLGTNLWINEFVFILFPALLLAKLNGWSFERVYRYTGTSGKNKVISILSGISIWFFAFYITKIISILLDTKIGLINLSTGNSNSSPIQSILLLIGMVILAPICEETFFRGLLQRSYEGYSKKYSFVFAALIFGLFHMMNGLVDVIPACIIGLVLGYLVYSSGSIYNSMLAHSASNFCALLFGGAFSMLKMTSIPIWLHIVAFSGLAISILLLKQIKAFEKQEETVNEVEASCKSSIKGIVILVLSILILTSIGIIEIMLRLGKLHVG